MTELKGLISRKGDINYTCCNSVPKILIDGAELHTLVKDLTCLSRPQNDDEYYTNEPKHQWQIEYCISPEPFTENTFQECAAQKMLDMLYSDAVTGCYSTWTCGLGDYDFVLDKNGHSLLVELASFIGQYVWISFGEVLIDTHPIEKLGEKLAPEPELKTPRDRITDCVEAIAQDLSERAGFAEVWKRITPYRRTVILQEWATIIETNFLK